MSSSSACSAKAESGRYNLFFVLLPKFDCKIKTISERHLVEVVVKNASSSPLSVTEIELTAGEAIVGEFYAGCS
jgi:hypothetical protein